MLPKLLIILALMASTITHAKPEDPAETCSSRLQAGSLSDYVLGNDAPSYEVDEQTKYDLSFDQLLTMLDKTKTVFGRARLKYLLSHPLLDAEEITERQEAIKELAENTEMREAISKAFSVTTLASQAWLDRLEKESHFPAWLSWAIQALTRVPVYFAIQNEETTRVLMASLAAVLIFPQMIFGSAMRETYTNDYRTLFIALNDIRVALNVAKSKQLKKISAVFNRLIDFENHHLIANLNVRLDRMVPHSQGRNMMFIPDLLWLHSARTMTDMGNRIVLARESLIELVSAMSELDVFFSGAELLRSDAQFQFPKFVNGPTPFLKIEDGHHPYWFKHGKVKSVPNSLNLANSLSTISRDASMAIISGPNKSGKSVFIRMAGLVPIVGQTGLPILGRATLVPMKVLSRMRIQDNEEKGESTYSADAKRLVEIDKEIGTSKVPMLVLIDEMVRGTNSRVGDVVERVIINDWVQSPHLFLIASHNENLPSLANGNIAIKNLHAHSEVKNGEVVSSFKVLPGQAEVINAVDLLQAYGLRPDLLNQIRASIPE